MRQSFVEQFHRIEVKHFFPSLAVGGKYCDVLNGTYKLEKLNDKTWRLLLWSNFQLTTTFKFYAGRWTYTIMKDIQNNILQIGKQQAENE